MIVGVGIDVVPVERFAQSLARTPSLADRLFTAAERVTPSGAERGAESLAARFAAKEAVAKALGGRAESGGGMRWTDAEVSSDADGRPSLRVTGTVAARAAALGVTRWHVSLSHDGGIASAVVIAEGLPGGVVEHSAEGLPGGVVEHSAEGLPGGVVEHSAEGLPGGVVEHRAEGLPGGVVEHSADS